MISLPSVGDTEIARFDEKMERETLRERLSRFKCCPEEVEVWFDQKQRLTELREILVKF